MGLARLDGEGDRPRKTVLAGGGSLPEFVRDEMNGNRGEKRPPKDIDDWRIRIDEIDLELVRLFNERTRCAIEIGHIKKRLGLDIYSPSREAQVIKNVTEASQGPLDAEAIRRLFERVIDEARRIERIEASEKQDESGDLLQNSD
jgi:chorismate mutase